MTCILNLLRGSRLAERGTRRLSRARRDAAGSMAAARRGARAAVLLVHRQDGVDQVLRGARHGVDGVDDVLETVLVDGNRRDVNGAAALIDGDGGDLFRA